MEVRDLVQECVDSFYQKDTSAILARILACVRADRRATEQLVSSANFPIVLLQIFTDAFSELDGTALSDKTSRTVCAAIELLSHLVTVPSYMDYFLEAEFPHYIYPFLLSYSDELVSLAALRLFSDVFARGLPKGVKGGDIIPLLLKVAGDGSSTAQLLALQVLEQILYDNGLDYAVQTLDRFQAISVVLGSLLARATSLGSAALLKRLFAVYLRLCASPHVKNKLKEKLPEGLDSKEMQRICAVDQELEGMRHLLVETLKEPAAGVRGAL